MRGFGYSWSSFGNSSSNFSIKPSRYSISILSRASFRDCRFFFRDLLGISFFFLQVFLQYSSKFAPVTPLVIPPNFFSSITLEIFHELLPTLLQGYFRKFFQAFLNNSFRNSCDSFHDFFLGIPSAVSSGTFSGIPPGIRVGELLQGFLQ